MWNSIIASCPAVGPSGPSRPCAALGHAFPGLAPPPPVRPDPQFPHLPPASEQHIQTELEDVNAMGKIAPRTSGASDSVLHPPENEKSVETELEHVDAIDENPESSRASHPTLHPPRNEQSVETELEQVDAMDEIASDTAGAADLVLPYPTLHEQCAGL